MTDESEESPAAGHPIPGKYDGGHPATDLFALPNGSLEPLRLQLP